MKLGMVGLPNSGKSTLFNALTESQAAAGNYPFSTVEKNVGIVTVADERLEILQKMYESKKTTNATIEFVDIAGLVKGSRDGGGLGNKFLGHIREMDGLVHVVRCFDDENVPHVDGNVDPVRDLQTIDLELIFADMEQVAKRIERVKRESKAGTATHKAGQVEIALLERVLVWLEDENLARDMDVLPEESAVLGQLGLLTFKPMIYVANIGEEDYACIYEENPKNEYIQCMRKFLNEKYDSGKDVFVVAAKVEEEMVGLTDEEKAEFLEMLGKGSTSLEKITKAAYDAINLMSFITAGPKEIRAWTIPKGTTALKAAGKIHSDLERGFIRAEIIDYPTLMDKGSYTACKDAGLLRLEGKEYIVQEGDIILFRFNV
ncbi:MAG: redox-regulated ATPase YchF [Defluviitaleaceae bacterium]|nr:redox-regulated ATPase YchF [Defluviitaleaceae bacterium]